MNVYCKWLIESSKSEVEYDDKTKILNEVLSLFSEKGNSVVYVGEIA